MTDYPLVSLGGVCQVTIGRQRSPKHASGDDMVPYLRAANVKDGVLKLDSVLEMNFSPAEQDTYRLLPGDVLVTEGCGSPTELGASAAWGGQIDGVVCFQNTLLRLRAVDGLSDARYLLHLARWCHRFGRWLEASSGTSILHIGHRRAQRLLVPMPALELQQRIGAILAIYDDLIEKNTRRIRILEEMARAIYREWFVEFRFPGHADVRLVESELGPIPEGWGVVCVCELVDIVRGRSYKSSELVDEGGHPFINLKCVKRDGGFRTDGLKRYSGQFKERQKTYPGDIVMAVTDMTQERRIVARAARVPRVLDGFAVISMDVVKLAPREDIGSSYLLGALGYSSFPDEVKNFANGATFCTSAQTESPSTVWRFLPWNSGRSTTHWRPTFIRCLTACLMRRTACSLRETCFSRAWSLARSTSPTSTSRRSHEPRAVHRGPPGRAARHRPVRRNGLGYDQRP